MSTRRAVVHETRVTLGWEHALTRKNAATIPAPLADLGNPNFAAFWTYWNSLPKQGLLPLLPDYLDHAPVDLQPGVLIFDLRSEKELYVRLAGTAVVEWTGELTGIDGAALYAKPIRKAVLKRAWTAVNHPCGYFQTRAFGTVSGTEATSSGLALPVQTKNPDIKTLMMFNGGTESTGAGDGMNEQGVVHKILGATWIDLGAGVPNGD